MMSRHRQLLYCQPKRVQDLHQLVSVFAKQVTGEAAFARPAVNHLQDHYLIAHSRVPVWRGRCRNYSLPVIFLFIWGITFPLAAQEQNQQLRGTVVDKTSLRPLQSVIISVAGTTSAVVVSDSGGRYKLDLLP